MELQTYQVREHNMTGQKQMTETMNAARNQPRNNAGLEFLGEIIRSSVLCYFLLSCNG